MMFGDTNGSLMARGKNTIHELTRNCTNTGFGFELFRVSSWIVFLRT